MAHHDFIYREATAVDSLNIAQLTLRAYQDHQAALAPSTWDTMHANLANQSLYAALLGKATTFVCETDSALIGVVFLLPRGHPTAVFSADWSYVRLLGVDPNYRGLGIGRQLMELCIHRARSMGEIGVALHTSEFMDAARRMYEELGFRPERELAPMYNKRYWLYTLRF